MYILNFQRKETLSKKSLWVTASMWLKAELGAHKDEPYATGETLSLEDVQ